jgi:hypothetical protein
MSRSSLLFLLQILAERLAFPEIWRGDTAQVSRRDPDPGLQNLTSQVYTITKSPHGKRQPCREFQGLAVV